MQARIRIWPIIGIFMLVSVAWIALSGTMLARTTSQESSLEGSVGSLWGRPQTQASPTFIVHWTVRSKKETVVYNSQTKAQEKKTEWVDVPYERKVEPVSAEVRSGLALDERRKGLVWFPLYTVDFSGRYIVDPINPELLDKNAENVEFEIVTRLPSGDGTYDGFELELNGTDISVKAERKNGALRYRYALGKEKGADFMFSYVSRGVAVWNYQPLSVSQEAGLIENFQLRMTTDFHAIDFPGGTMSPSTKERTDEGWILNWAFDRIMTGQNIGMVMPQRVQPGHLGAKLSASAPISLGFFTVVLYVLSFLRGHRIHPIHYMFIGASFFSFHLLFAYTADHLPVEWAFALASGTSVVLVVSYLRLVISSRFAFGPVAIAQMIYVVGFSVAHFFEGFTGLAITVLGITTLFWLMQITGKIDWYEKTAGPGPDLSNPELEATPS
jgi:inner membrane protein involved in colicin E2 resistance